MKRFLLACLIALTCSANSWAISNFNATNAEGVTIYYAYVSQSDYTVEVTWGGNRAGMRLYTGDVIIPTTADYHDATYDVIGLSDQAFYNGTVTSVTLPEVITYLGDGAFSGCSSMTSLTCLNPEPPSCGEDAFSGVDTESCVLYVPTKDSKNLYASAEQWKDFTNIEVIGGGGHEDGDKFYVEEDNLYYEVVSAEDKTVVVTWGDGYNFNNSVGTTNYTGSINIPNNTTDEYGDQYVVIGIGGAAFQFCTKLTSITIPEGLTSIGGRAFRGCTSVNFKSVSIPNSVEALGDSLFMACRYLSSIKLPNGLKTIPLGFIWNCYNITSIDIPETVTTIGERAFYGCEALANVKIPEGVTSIGQYAFYDCQQIRTLVIPEGVTTIEPFTFGHCYGLTSMIISESVTNLRQGSFQKDTSLEEITIPASVASVGRQAFQDCTALAKVYSLNPEPPTGLSETTFENIDSECVLYVPVDSKEVYEYSEYWEDFYDIVEMTEFAIETLAATDVTDSSATLNGSVTAAYNDPITEKGFEYWTENGETETIIISDEDVEMTYTLESLSPETTYTYRAYAVMESGTTEYGEAMTFTTDTPEGIGIISIEGEKVDAYYSVSGQQLKAPKNGVINIIRYNDGAVKKIYVK